MKFLTHFRSHVQQPRPIDSIVVQQQAFNQPQLLDVVSSWCVRACFTSYRREVF